MTHAISYPGPVLSMGISPDCRTLAAGLATGLLAVKRHAKLPAPAAARAAGTVAGSQRARRRAPLTAANYRYFLRGQSAPASADDYRVRAQRRVRLAPFDRALRKFLYRDALDAALGSGKPEVVASVLQELTTRSGLNAALGAFPCRALSLRPDVRTGPRQRSCHGCHGSYSPPPSPGTGRPGSRAWDVASKHFVGAIDERDVVSIMDAFLVLKKHVCINRRA